MMSLTRLSVFGRMSGAILSACLVLMLNLTVVSLSQAVIEMDQLSNPELSTRYRKLIEEYRCPKCQNQNLADSDSPISVDLRREIRRMLEEGASDEQISDYLVARYGDFVLYRPRFQQGTYLLWWGPGLLLVAGLSVAGMVIGRQRAKARAVGLTDRDGLDPGSLSDAEQQALDDLLAESGIDSDGAVASCVEADSKAHPKVHPKAHPKADGNTDKPTS